MSTMENSTDAENEVKKWLQIALAKENLENLSVDIAGNSEKGDGYIGEITFLVATGTNKSVGKKRYNLALKCSKASAALMEKCPIRESFIREMYVYEKIFPTFRAFQTERGVEKPFDSVPKCYGTYHDEFRYVIALENLKKMGYELWTNDTSLTRKHIELIVKKYAKFHAVSVAMKEQEPQKFQELIDGLEDDVLLKFFKMSDFVTIYKNCVDEVAELLKNDLSEDHLKKWLSFKDQLHYVCLEMAPATDDLHVITHADCWNNNFLHKHADDEKSIPSKVAMLDWQMSKYSSPVFDLSYFLFACISGQDIGDMDTILRMYYETLDENVTKMGSTLGEKYPVEKLLQEWKKYGKYGVMISLLAVKVPYTSKDDLPDMAKSAESGEDFGATFSFSISDKIGYRNRLRPLVRYALDNGLI